MANNFKNKLSANIHSVGTPSGFANVGSYTVPSGCVATIIGLSISNVSNTGIDVDVVVNSATGPTGNINVVKAAPIPVGGSLVAVGGDQKIVLETNHSMMVKANSGNVDVVMSILESDQA